MKLQVKFLLTSLILFLSVDCSKEIHSFKEKNTHLKGIIKVHVKIYIEHKFFSGFSESYAKSQEKALFYQIKFYPEGKSVVSSLPYELSIFETTYKEASDYLKKKYFSESSILKKGHEEAVRLYHKELITLISIIDIAKSSREFSQFFKGGKYFMQDIQIMYDEKNIKYVEVAENYQENLSKLQFQQNK